MKRSIMVCISLLTLVILSYQTGCAKTASPPAPIRGTATAADPMQIPYIAGPFKIDADPSDWTSVAFLPEPFMKKPAGSVKMCWNENGLYVLAVVQVKEIKVDSANAWEGDCLELFLEKDAAASLEMSDNAVQYLITPTPDAGEGKCSITVAQGTKANVGKIASAWKKTADGYVIEMRIPTETLAPAKLAAGTKMNLNFAIDSAGKALEQFASDKSTDDGYKNPKSWGTVILTK